MYVKQKQDRTRRSGHKHAMNIQDFPPTVYTEAQRAAILCKAAENFVGMIGVWGTERRAESTARAAALALVDVIEKENRNAT